MKKLGLVFLIVLSFFITGCGKTDNKDTTTSNKDKEEEKIQSKVYKAVITVKDYGEIELKLDGTVAPITVENFVKLVNEKFYDGLTFHRIMSGFMVQGGDPLGNGTGNSKDKIKGEFSENGVENSISHVRGVISMARRGGNPETEETYNSASCQFFIVHQDSKFLDGKYAAFGYVTKGMEIVDKIAKRAKPIDNNGTILKNEQPIIEKIRIVE